MNVHFFKVHGPSFARWGHIALPDLRDRLEAASTRQIGKYIVVLSSVPEEIREFFDIREARCAVMDDFGNLVRVGA